METFYYLCDFLNTSVQIWFVLQLLRGMFEAKTDQKRIYVGQAVMIGGIALVKCGNDISYQVLFSNGMLVLMALLVTWGGKLLYKYRFLDGFCLNILVFILLALVDFFIQTSASVILEEHGGNQYLLRSFNIWRGCYLLIAAILLLFLGTCLRNWLAERRKEIFRYRKQQIFMIFPLLVCMVYFQNIYIFSDSRRLLNHWGIFVLGVVLLGVLFWLYTVKRGTEEMVRMQQMKIEMLESNYLSLQQIYNEKAVLIHDMKNHMYMMKDIFEKGDVSEALVYVEGIAEELQKSGNMRWTRHEMLDFILNRKIQEARQAGIVVKCKCDDMRGIVLTTMEICALFGNLLDNAIEANMRCPEGTKRSMNIECRKREKMLLVKLQNRMSEKSAEQGIQILETTEKEKGEHGFGMKSIRKVVEHHEGDIETVIRKDFFQIEISLVGFTE